MKKNFIAALFFLLLSCHYRLAAQHSCEDPNCVYNGSYNISTGFDFGINGYLSPVSLEQNWELTIVPGNAPVTLPAPVWVIAPNGSWSTFSSAQWISPFQTNMYALNNWPSPPALPWRFENCFCVCEDTWVNIEFDLLSDDAAIARIDGNLLGSFTTGNQFQWPNRINVDTIVFLTAGEHCIEVDVFNGSGGGFGFGLQGSVLGNGLQKAECCDPTGRICGSKLDDCSGTGNSTITTHLPGWTIVLKDANGNVIATTTTDASGNYCFDNLNPGNYNVSEVLNLPGWIQTFPGGGSHNISLSAGDAVVANFGNCNPYLNENPCHEPINFTYAVNQCGVAFTTPPMYFNPGTFLAGIHWDFGDGTNSTEADPVHYYAASGVYQVCLTYTYFDGAHCCTKEACQWISVDDPCEGGCNIDVDFTDSLWNDSSCTYLFSGVINSTGTPITDWFWTFGDGTTGTGANASHYYLNSGTYQVCLTVFGETIGDDEDHVCCFEKVCRDIVVTCGPCDEEEQESILAPSSGEKTRSRALTDPLKYQPKRNDMPVIVLDQNVPNPFHESTIITYAVPGFKKAQIHFWNAEGKLINTFNIPDEGEGRLTVFAGDLGSGKYTYTLVVDGKIIQSKQMIKQ